MLVNLDCSVCGERTYPEATIDADDLLFTIPPCKKCLKDQADRMIEEIEGSIHSIHLDDGWCIGFKEGHEKAIEIIEKEAGI